MTSLILDAHPVSSPYHALALQDLDKLLGDRLTLNASVCMRHGTDESYHTPYPPDAVAYPESTEEVAAIARICSQAGVPIIPFGAGTSLEGNIAALQGGVCVDLSRMNRILRTSLKDMDVTVEAGVTRKQLNAHIRDAGLFFPIDPGPDATLGGMAATRASGTNAVRYGTMREAVLGLTVVLADGSVVHTGGRARKSSAGYDLTRLFVGSEGTLGLMTEVTLRLHGLPEASSVAVCQFNTIADAVDSVIAVMQSGIPVARIELMDEVQVRAINLFSKLNYAELPTLFFEFHGSEASVKEQAEIAGLCTAEHNGGEFSWASTPEARTKLWQARHDALYAAIALRPGCKAWPTDVCVPISALAQCINETREDLKGTALPCPIVGHVGDGNFHIIFVVDPESASEIAEVTELNKRLVARALALGGTCTGEHGIGWGKRDFLQQEHATAVPVMRLIKAALDPRGIMNPGKLFDATAPG